MPIVLKPVPFKPGLHHLRSICELALRQNNPAGGYFLFVKLASDGVLSFDQPSHDQAATKFVVLES